jgi:hypothetical protein
VHGQLQVVAAIRRRAVFIEPAAVGEGVGLHGAGSQEADQRKCKA